MATSVKQIGSYRRCGPTRRSWPIVEGVAVVGALEDDEAGAEAPEGHPCLILYGRKGNVEIQRGRVASCVNPSASASTSGVPRPRARN